MRARFCRLLRPLIASFFALGALGVVFPVVAVAQTLDFSPLGTPLNNVAGDVIPSAGSLLGNMGGITLVFLTLGAVAIVLWIVLSFVKRMGN